MRLNRLTRKIELELLAAGGVSLRIDEIEASFRATVVRGNVLMLLRIRPQFIDEGGGLWSLDLSAIPARGET